MKTEFRIWSETFGKNGWSRPDNGSGGMRRLSMGENTKDSQTALGFPESERLAVFTTAIENPDP